MGFILERSVLYLMIDGVGVERQGKMETREESEIKGKRECKVAIVLRQKGEKISRLATFATWERISGFKKTLEWVMLGLYGLCSQIVMIGDGAKWIRNLRKKIPLLKRAIWILDWFHLKDRTLKMLRLLEKEESDPLSQQIIELYWFGQGGKAMQLMLLIPLSDELEEAQKQKEALKKYQTYIKNQQEGIINYQAYKMKGYVVGSGCVEKMNDQLIKSRMVRQRRIRWSLKGGEAMMQLLTAKMNGRLGELFA